MEKYKFGMEAELVNSQNVGDFVEYTKRDGDNWNPYNSAYFDKPENRAECKETGRITSIPSPYARMHITDLAFREANCGIKSGGAAVALSKDYNKALSHCLDIFELLFNADRINLKEIGITIDKVDLVSTHSTEPNVQAYLNLQENSKVKNYIATLDLFRDEYVRVVRSKNVNDYLFDFKSLYVMKKDGKSFAATSPLTGFYAKADCNIEKLEIDGHRLLSSAEDTWRGIEMRSYEFRAFMYSLLKDTGLSRIYENLYNNVFHSLTDQERNAIDAGPRFIENREYFKFNIGGTPLQQLGVDNNVVYIRPDGLDCSYLKYLLYLGVAVDLSIKESDYNSPLNERQFNGMFTQWIGVNDILSDSLFVLTYEINDNYLTIPYKDYNDGQFKKRCLIPIKKEALNYFTVDELSNMVEIERKDAVTYLVTLTLPLANGGHSRMYREYKADDKAVDYPNGKVFQGDEMKPFAFGIYPFVKSNHYSNMHKVLFYNSFDNAYSLKFYKRDNNGNIVALSNLETSFNKTNSINNPESRVNCEYHDINVAEGIEFAEVSVSGKYTSLIVPKLRVLGHPGFAGNVDIQNIPGEVTVAIDLGTTNTYVAYTHAPMPGMPMQPMQEINTHHVDMAGAMWNELTFMNKRVMQSEIPDMPDKHREDLYLRVSDRQAPVDTWLSAQLNEFIPSRIEPSDNNANYKFPIPTVINFLRNDTQRKYSDKNVPLLNFSIPFAYYERGVRKGAQQHYYDLVRDGSDFKWFVRKDRFGNNVPNETNMAAFNAFLSELMFIVRCHLICRGYDLDNCRIIWSYPLSFSSRLREEYSKAWVKAYKQFINPQVLENQIDNYVMYTNESRTPIYDCLENPNAANQLTLLLDIGGGSTDVIGYKNFNVKFVTSFGFAGNALYLNSSMNTIDNNQMDNTLLKKYVLQQPLIKNGGNENNTGSVCDTPIDASQSISTLMNYGFSKSRNAFESIFQNEPAKYMLLIHNASIIYHVAQLCKIFSPEEVPAYIYFTGNGSKQFKLNLQRDQMVRDVFSSVYGVDASGIRVSESQNPKAATARGALKGLWNRDAELATNAASLTDCVTMLGDSKTIARADVYGNCVVNAPNYAADVKENVVKFFELFYENVYTTVTPVMTLAEVKQFINNVAGDSKLRLPQNGVINDSYFFQYVALVMQQISINLAERGAAGN